MVLYSNKTLIISYYVCPPTVVLVDNYLSARATSIATCSLEDAAMVISIRKSKAMHTDNKTSVTATDY